MSSSPSHFSLLVVDDEPDLRTLYELTLLREGYDIETAGTVEEALLHLKDRTYSAVISDMRLPDGTGLGLYICRELCERYGASIDYRLQPAGAPNRNEFFVAMRRQVLTDSEARLNLSH